MPSTLPPTVANAAIEGVTRFAFDLADGDVPDATRAHVGLLLLDTLGVAAAATGLPAGVAARGAAVAMFGSERADAAHLVFDGRAVSTAGAVFALAAQIDNLDAHDGYTPSKGHIGVVVVPSLLAHAQRHVELTMVEALTALTVGYEVAARAGLALHATVPEYHTSGAWNALGATALAARLDGLARPLLREALGIAEYHGPRSQMMRGIDWPTMVHDGAGWGGLAGSAAVSLAVNGFTGAPAITVEDDAVREIWSDLGARWAVDEHYVKTYPVCRWTHPMIDAALAVRAEPTLSLAAIERIEITTFDEGTHLYQGVPDTTTVAQYASSFPVAAALVHGRVGVAEISGDGLSDDAVARLVGVTRVTRSPAYDDCFPAERLADVTVVAGGREYRSGTRAAGGLITDHTTPAAVRRKFHALADPVLGPGRSDAIEAIVTGHRPGDRFAGLLDLLVPAP